MFMCVDQNAGRNHNMKRGNKSFGRVRQLKFLGTTLTNENSIQDDVKSTLKSGNACYHSVQNFCHPVCNPKIESFIYTEL